ncbi:amidohydrolase family protein [Pokkaliibacter sp. MBI-7]|uniref:amidohydrolase family protein n=1 Tax=Pokkaliibacter sp. MBI-7 TaxID=3040600 RepID=UPI00244C214B|nr:amidohydrolase family protein [Pokkaliibacter sp. MBI-7]MDH2431735.1 amidohydrolase family protein [Pokkaliibacter sp. MBI-7]
MKGGAIRVDAHQHFWQIGRGDYGWLTPELEVLYRDYVPEDLLPLLAQQQIDATILVQAAPTLAETEYLLRLAEQHTQIAGVVGWVDFASPGAVADIQRLARHPKLVGLRPMLQDIADTDWMLRAELHPAYEAMTEAGLVFDALVTPRHLPSLLQLLRRYPELRVVIDHAAKPQIRDAAFQPWAEQMAQLAAETQACCKLSGLVTEAGERWSVADLQPYVDHLLQTFGSERLLWGSDWPVCLLAADYAQWRQASEQLLEGVEDTDGIFGLNAARVYGVGGG